MHKLLTVTDYAALGETEPGYTELVNGRLLLSPIPTPDHNMDKRGEYADAGIPWYWIVDISEPVSVVACRFTEDFGYVDHQRVTGTFTTEEPFAVTVDLDRLC